MNTRPGLKTKTIKASRRMVPIMASDAKATPGQIELIKAGIWPAGSAKGPLTITVTDLHEFKNNFDAGIGLPGEGMIGLPIDFSHEEWSQAAGWINSLDVVGDTLVANVTWTAEGEEALLGGMYKCISPSFWPACMGEWYDPEDSEVTARNVLVGAGLTNIPFFKDLSPIMASNTSEGGKSKNVIYINADERKIMPTLDEIRVKEATSLTDEEKAFVLEHKAELSAEEVTKFGLDEAPVETPEAPEEEPEAPAAVADPEAVAVAASVKAGTHVVMAAADIKAMNDKIDASALQLAKYRKAEVTASVTAHVKRGAIKADQLDTWVTRIMADESSESLLETLNANPVLASEMGTEAVNDISAEAQLKAAAEKLVDEKKMTYGQALIQASRENPELEKARQAEKSN